MLAWPRALRAAWMDALVGSADFLGDAAPSSDWSTRRQKQVQFDAGRYLAWLHFTGRQAETTADLATVSGPETLAAFAAAEHARGTKLTSLATSLGNVVGFLRCACGRTWNAGAAWRIVDRIRCRARQLPRTHRAIADPDALYDAGLQQMEDALNADGFVTDPAAWQDGLMLALLAAVPIRISNFATLRVGTHLLGGGREPWRIILSAGETKTRRADAWDVPESLSPYLDHFVTVVRPMLLGSGPARTNAHDALWVGAFGQPIEHQAVRKRVKAVTAARLGRTILPHSFRHSVATSFALRNPDRPRDTASLLGHAGPRTTEQHYLLSEQQLARAKFQAMLEARLRRSGAAADPTAEP